MLAAELAALRGGGHETARAVASKPESVAAPPATQTTIGFAGRFGPNARSMRDMMRANAFRYSGSGRNAGAELREAVIAGAARPCASAA